MRILIASFVLLFCGKVIAEETFLCVADDATGFTMQDGSKWSQRNFFPSKKYIVKKNGDSGTYFEVGKEPSEEAIC